MMQGDSDSQHNIPLVAGQSLFAGKIPIEVALNELRLRLLDLTGRNRLINYKHSAGKSLQFVHTSIDGTFRRLLGDQNNKVTISPLPEPERSDWVSRGGRLGRPDPKDYALKVGINPSYELNPPTGAGTQARTLFYAEDLGKHGRKLEREAKLAFEETGANMLYLVLGFLEYTESPDSEKLYRAPLICIPVSMSRTDGGQYSSFYLNYTGEELADNLSLREKVKRDFGLNLPEYDADGEASVEKYLEAVSEATAHLPNWRVRRMMTLTLLSFTNMLLERDLRPENWPTSGKASALLTHPLVKQVFEGKPSDGEAQYADEYAIDDHPKGDLPLIYDADSSQHSALIDVLEGKSRVIEGPPGTGKSQTITNLIAAALQAGKKVLFVAEKLAALEVVKSRLSLAGLDPFVLELHSNKTNKKRVLEDLANRINLRIANVSALQEKLLRQEGKRRELKAYADLMNAKVGNELGLTLHQVMWRAELNRMRCGESESVVKNLNYPAAPQTAPAQLGALCDRLRYLAVQFEPIGTYGPEHALWGFFPSGFKPEDDLPVRSILTRFATKFATFAASTYSAAELLGGVNLNMSAKSAEDLMAVLAKIAPANEDDVAFWLLPQLFPAADPNGVRSLATLRELSETAASIDAAEVQVSQHLRNMDPASDELAAEAMATLLELTTLGIGAVAAPNLAAAREGIERVAAEVEGALQRIAAFAALASLDFDGSVDAVRKLTTLAASIREAPRDSLHLQHSGLRGQSVVATLERAIEGLQANQRSFETLNATLYMDALPTDGELDSAILTLREGDAWYRVFQRRWRDAVNLHKRLQRQKVKTSAFDRQSELEQLRQLRRSQTAWNTDPQLHAAVGPHFRFDNTPFAELLSLAKWVQSTDSALESVGLPISALDGTTVDKSLLSGMLLQLPLVEAATVALQAFSDKLGSLFPHAYPNKLHEFSDGDWRQRIVAANAAIGVLSGAESLLTTHVRPETPADLGLKAIVSSRDVPNMDAQFAASAEGRALFGERYAGRRTDFEAAMAAHTYASMVKRAGLPERVERILISPECLAKHGLISKYVEDINLGWQAVLDFHAEMAKCGRFEPVTWADPSGRSTSEYAHALASKTRTASDQVGSLMAWAQYIGARDEVTKAGLEGFVSQLESGGIPPAKLVHAFLYRFYATVAQSVFTKSPSLQQFSGLRHSSVRNDFATLDKEIIRLRGRQVGRDCCDRSSPPAGSAGALVGDKTEMELLNHLMPQQRPRVPVRQMLRRAGRAIQELKPCFMMGPQAVAQFLAPGHLHFDIVVMDEASQLRPEEAIGAVARGGQLVVVGDPKQLPPTSFFARINSADGDGQDGMGQMATSEAESILDVCISHFQPVRTLRWHYRSRHESLIAFSNHHFYRGNLVVFPSPYPKSKSLGLRYQYVPDGVYENQMNQVEARCVVEAAVEHILHRSDDSLGIVTLNIKQRDLVAEMLEERLRNLPEAATFRERWEKEGMGLFIKNLENVQGDERDCIFISTTFGKPKSADVVRQNFGPISRDGGWRRLNVLFTRSRKSVAVFSSMRPEDIVVDGKTPEGTRALRNYLEFARTGVLPMDKETGLPPDSDFEIAVMDVLKSRGYEVEPQLGIAGFRIDIGVRHPVHKSGYLAAIECDGASYHSGLSVRDRDRIRQEILEGLGWRNRIWRIWSTDWFRNPLAETERLIQFLEELKGQPIPDEYLVSDETALSTAAAPAGADGYPRCEAEDFIIEDEDEDLEIDVGDLITYASTDAPEKPVQVRLTARQTNPELGLVAESTPLGSILCGATVGEIVVLRVPGRGPQSFIIQGIKRAYEATTQ